MKQSIQVQYKVDCEWDSAPPRYRLFVNDELFVERTWVWTSNYLEEVIPIDAPPGDYNIRYELIGSGNLAVSNGVILSGSAEILPDNVIRIHSENT